MKLLLLIVSIIAVFTVDSRELPHKPGVRNSFDNLQRPPGSPPNDHRSTDLNNNIDYLFAGDEEEDKREGSKKFSDNPQRLDSYENDQHFMENENVRKERSLRALKCESTICGILGGSCITNGTICSGWLVLDGCRGPNCHCCIPGTLEMKMKHFELELQSMKDDLANSSMQLKMDFQSMIENITNTKLENQKELQAFRETLSNSTSNLASEFQAIGQNVTADIAKLKSLKLNQGCPKGYFYLSTTNQCFKYYNDVGRTWTAAKSKCAADGAVLAKPYEPLSLRNYLVMRYGGSGHPWLGARGTGSSIKWDRDGKILGTSNKFWYSSAHKISATSKCLVLMVYESAMVHYETTLYYMYTCTSSQYAVCEYVRE